MMAEAVRQHIKVTYVERFLRVSPPIRTNFVILTSVNFRGNQIWGCFERGIMSNGVLVRYGSIHEIARFAHELREPLVRGAEAVVRTHRGLEIGVLLEPVGNVNLQPNLSANGNSRANGANGRHDESPRIVRPATAQDLAAHFRLREECKHEFENWRERIKNWKLELELIDAEWTLDRSKLILYVLNERGPECTKLALAAAAAGLGLIEVQPVTADGLLRLDMAAGGSGCGSGGCGCGA